MPTFSSNERIKSKKLIDSIFESGESHKHFPYRLKMLWDEGSSAVPLQIVVSVPKRSVKKAVKRNRIKRQIKEAYRLNKQTLINALKKKERSLSLFLIFTGKEDMTYKTLEKKMIELLKQLEEKI